jgi:hypothetical protein
MKAQADRGFMPVFDLERGCAARLLTARATQDPARSTQNGFCIVFLTTHNGQRASLAERPHIL